MPLYRGSRRLILRRVASGLDSATVAWAAAVTAAGGTVSTGRKTIVNAFIVGLKADSLFTKLDRFWLFAGEDHFAADIDLINLGTHTNHGMTFTASKGYAGDGVSQYGDTGYAPLTNGVAYTQNSACFGLQLNTAVAPTGNIWACGTSNGGSFSQLSGFVPNSGGNMQPVLNGSSNTNIGAAGGAGSYIFSRASSSVFNAYMNGTANGFNPLSSTSTALPSLNWLIDAVPDPSPDAFCADQISSFFVGGALNGTDVTNLETRMHTLMSAISNAVY